MLWFVSFLFYFFHQVGGGFVSARNFELNPLQSTRWYDRSLNICCVVTVTTVRVSNRYQRRIIAVLILINPLFDLRLRRCWKGWRIKFHYVVRNSRYVYPFSSSAILIITKIYYVFEYYYYFFFFCISIILINRFNNEFYRFFLIRIFTKFIYYSYL